MVGKNSNFFGKKIWEIKNIKIINNPNPTINSPNLNPKNLIPTKDLVNIIIKIEKAKMLLVMNKFKFLNFLLINFSLV